MHEEFVAMQNTPILHTPKKAKWPANAVTELPTSRHAYASDTRTVAYEFTHDPALLHQYYILREKMFINVWNLEHFNGHEDAFDAVSDIMLLRSGKLCVGGARLTFSTPDQPRRLPFESEGFTLQAVLPELDLANHIYGECGRFTVLPDFQSRDVSLNMWTKLIERCRLRGADYVMWIAPAQQTRNNRQIAKMLDVPCKAYMNLEVPMREEYEGIRMYLSVLDISAIEPAPLAKREENRELEQA